MYKGIQAYVVLCLKPALQYTIFEQVKAVIVKTRRSKHLSAAEAFLLGMIADHDRMAPIGALPGPGNLPT